MSNNIESAALVLSEKLGVEYGDILEDFAGFSRVLNYCHELAVLGGWWNDPTTGEKKDRNKGELLCLIHSEVSEAMEGERKNLNDDHLPERKMAEVELADTVVRIGDYAAGFDHDVAEAMMLKMAYNVSRADHKPENRAKDGGKSF